MKPYDTDKIFYLRTGSIHWFRFYGLHAYCSKKYGFCIAYKGMKLLKLGKEPGEKA